MGDMIEPAVPKTATQMARYAFAGLLVNAASYGFYLLLTWTGIGHKAALTIVFVGAVTTSYLANKRFTFSHPGDVKRTYAKFWVMYGACYVVNLGSMYVGSDVLGYKHQFVQLAFVVVAAPALFLIQRVWVFGRVKLPGIKYAPE